MIQKTVNLAINFPNLDEVQAAIKEKQKRNLNRKQLRNLSNGIKD